MKVEFGGEPCWLAIISARRPERVPVMTELLGRKATWYIPVEETEAYHSQGVSIAQDGGSLSGARNAAIEHAKLNGLPCLQFSDDLKKIQVARDGKAHDATPDEAFGRMLSRFSLSDFMLAGVAPTNNAFFSKDKLSSANLFCVGDCLAIKASSTPRFDPGLPLKEDYDFTAQHITTYGGVLRCDDILLTFAHYTNAGGAVDVRTAELEQEIIAKLMARWPGMIKRHPRRENEVLLRAPRAKKATL